MYKKEEICLGNYFRFLNWGKEDRIMMKKGFKMAIIGLGYVGMPLAIAFSKKLDVIGFDINE